MDEHLLALMLRDASLRFIHEGHPSPKSIDFDVMGIIIVPFTIWIPNYLIN
jgi:hypothetical protein